MTDLCRTLIAAVALAGSSVTASAETITVCASGCDYASINAAIGAANDGDVIQLAAETYFEGEQIDPLGKAITLRGVLDKAGEPASVLDGAGKHRVLICRNDETGSTVFENLLIQNGSGVIGAGMYNESSSPTLTDCTFSGNSSEMYGAGMYNYLSRPTLSNCAFTNNSSDFGGGMLNWASSPSVDHCTFAGNRSNNQSGAGMLNYDSSLPTISSSLFCGNVGGDIFGDWIDGDGNCIRLVCDDGDGDGVPDCVNQESDLELAVPGEYASVELAVDAAAPGAVIHVDAGIFTPDVTLDTQGKAITIRGAIDESGHPATVIDGRGEIRLLQCVSGETSDTVFENLAIRNGAARGLTDNDGGTSAADGGGIYNKDSSPSLVNCTFTENSADRYGGGGFNTQYSNPVLTGCTFTGNTAVFSGGGMRNYFSHPTLNNCTFTKNSAQIFSGGGMSNSSSDPVLTACTLCDNTPNQISGAWDDGGSNCVATSCDDCDLPSDACPTDLDLNGITDGGDLGVFFVHWGDCQVEDCPADFNDDEVVDGIDLGILFSAWGPCR